MTSKNWSTEETLKLIGRYEEHENLWNIHIHDYKDRLKRSSSLKLLSEEFETSVEEINRKLHNLRSQHSSEQKKLSKKKSGAGTSENHVVKWPFFTAMNFLVGVTTVRPTTSNMDEREDEENSVDSEAGDMADERSGKSFPEPSKRKMSAKSLPTKKQSTGTVPNALLEKAAEILSEPEDEYSTFGKYLASEMRAFRLEDSRRRFKIGVQRLLLEISEQEYQAQQWQNVSGPTTQQYQPSLNQWQTYNYGSYETQHQPHQNTRAVQ